MNAKDKGRIKSCNLINFEDFEMAGRQAGLGRSGRIRWAERIEGDKLKNSGSNKLRVVMRRR